MATSHESMLTFPVVGIGASAGGITAIQSLLRLLGGRAKVAIVVIQHLPPGEPSGLAELIRKWTPMIVHDAVDGLRPQPGRLYLPAPHEILHLVSGHFRTRPAEEGGRRPGIDSVDAFLESLADDMGPRAVAVVLSGTGTDGTQGAAQVRARGGMVLVQSPATALHDAMPASVIEHGLADQVLSITDIADELTAMGSPDYERPSSSAARDDPMPDHLDKILGLIRRQAGFDLSSYKPSPMLWRIQQRMNSRRTKRFADYEALLRDDLGELDRLVKGLPIHVTEFFRDPDAWKVIEEDVIGTLSAGDPIRAWTPACASGEEAYSVAMLLAEHGEAAGRAGEFQVFATDASPEIVARASRGVFAQRALAGLSPERRDRFLYAADGRWRVKRALRERMVFAPQDLLVDPPFTQLDLITCRNLLIYLERDAIHRALALLHGALRVGGCLFLGRGEPLSGRQSGFEAISTKWHIYRKTRATASVVPLFPKHLERIRDATAVLSAGHRAAIESQQLPSVLIDDTLTILKVYGDTGPYLKPAPEHAMCHLIEVAQPHLARPLRAAVLHTLRRGEALALDVPGGTGGPGSIGLRVTPTRTGDGADVSQLLISFIAAADRRSDDMGDGNSADEGFGIGLAVSRDELDASREELQALNEELKSSNEQLNLSNEELNRANAQLEQKIAQLEMQSRVLRSGGVATLFLDQEGKVRWFTRAVAEIFPLLPGDEGRPLADFTPRVGDAAFFEDVDRVMQTGQPREAEVRDASGRSFLRRIRPFLRGAEPATGVAITFTDITERATAEQALRESESALAVELDAMTRLHDLADRLLSIADTQTALEEVLHAALGLFDADRGTVQVHDAEADALTYAAAIGFDPEVLGRVPRIDRDFHSTCAKAIRTGQRVVAADIASDPEWSDHAPTAAILQYKSAISAPMKTRRDELQGVLTVHFCERYAPTERELRWIDLFARLGAHLVERARAEAALRASHRRSREKMGGRLETAAGNQRAREGRSRP